MEQHGSQSTQRLLVLSQYYEARQEDTQIELSDIVYPAAHYEQSVEYGPVHVRHSLLHRAHEPTSVLLSYCK